MQTIKLNIQDSLVDKVYSFLKTLPINDFGYKPDTSLEVGIERFVKWYKEFYIEKVEK
ncbi:MAG: hypothetical protein U9Q33_03800 [Campylobacterota bacterium]|nr:hypothetical protein [Campylobacterota bacterium]